ncbi:23S rRNA (uracil(1939)-C(5))-methyltransferase RlmD [uncultured Paenibacillus sp.]|uniref:23S rRNA (uracil(1939)-C(5))-methyltransferase RlmD n=1 Tax=uncultured Paenibacillus sp. TaxID=227322 RepID=UPI0015AB03E6|nr:23S rRNA (uracil(1939)-C(5))-methyltransferase RlmD [uncultured Paenibacillus sp.]
MAKQRSNRGRSGGGRMSGARGQGQTMASGARGSRGERRESDGSLKSRGRTAVAEAAIAGLPVAKNDEVVLDIVGMNHDGEGVGRAEGYTLFVAGALPGEKARVKVLKTKKQYGYAKLLDVVEASPDRVAPPCPIYDKCGGCQLQHLGYDAQLVWKRQHVVDALERIGKLRVTEGAPEAGAPMGGSAAGRADGDHAVVVRPTLGMAEPWRYRNKAQVPVGVTDGALVGGFYARGSHRIVDMETCLIQHESNDDVVSRVKAIGRRLGITAYDEETGKGLLRHVVVKVGFRTGEMMLVLVTNGDRIPHEDEWIAAIREEMPSVVSICQNVNTWQTNVIFGDVTRVLWGREVILDYIGDVKFAISARSFYQVNPLQTEVLYGKTVEYAGLTGHETVIDAYCGIGTISLFLAQHAKRVYGVEIVKEAIEDARVNAELNGMSHVTFEVGASEDVIPAWKEQGIEADVIVVDPPRKGCDPRLLDTILEMKPERVVYVSCNPATLARDLRILEDGGYRTLEVTPVDMFPHTVHVESVARLYRQE